MSLHVRAGNQANTAANSGATAHPAIKGPMAFVADAGSSGTRLFAFKWKERKGTIEPGHIVKPPQSRPKEIKFPDAPKGEDDINEVKFEIASIDDINTAKQYVKKLKDIALQLPGLNGRKNIPIYIKATAGMRLLADNKIKRVLALIKKAFNGVDLFKFEEENLFVTSGTEEAMYDWLSVNYLENPETLKIKKRPKTSYYLTADPKLRATETWGALDLGGASTQISFVPDEPKGILNNWVSVRPFHHTFRLYAVSHLGYGADQMELQIANIVRQEKDNQNPCLFRKDKKLYSTRGRLKECKNKEQEDENCKYQTGTGEYESCKNIIKEILALDNRVCKQFYTEAHCSINGVYIPSIPTNMPWIAFSAFFHTMGLGQISVKDIVGKGRNVCRYPWGSQLKGLYPKTPENFLKVLCLRHVYVHTILKDAYHFHDETEIDFQKKINGDKSGWQWGSILYDANLLPYKLKVDDQHSYKISRAKSEYKGDYMDDYMDEYMGNYMDAENEIYDNQTYSLYLGYYWSVIWFFMMTIFVSCCVCGLVVVIGIYLAKFCLKTKRINKREYEMV